MTDNAAAGKITLQGIFSIGDSAPANLDLKVWIDGNLSCQTTVVSDESRFELPLAVSDPKLWSPQEPNLYTLRIQLGDDIVEMNLGLRTIRTDGPTILLNDKPIAVKGINRHNMHMHFGFALPEAMLLHDAMLIKKIGANFIRGSHYPQDPRFLDICDRLGLMVWSEATGWGYDQEMLCDPRMLPAQTLCIEEMIRQSADHPCVVCWGFFNECASDRPQTRPIYEKLIQTIRQVDPTRPVTFASNHIEGEHGCTDLMLDLVDWIGVNSYPGWYGGDLNDAAERLVGLADTLERTGHTDRPIIISEIGAGAIPGHVHHWPRKWSEDYQARLFDIILTQIKRDHRFNGLCIWQYCDILSSEALTMLRPRGYNNKGIVDEYRRPKQAFTVVRNHYSHW